MLRDLPRALPHGTGNSQKPYVFHTEGSSTEPKVRGSNPRGRALFAGVCRLSHDGATPRKGRLKPLFEVFPEVMVASCRAPFSEDVPPDLIETKTFGSRVIYKRYERAHP